MKKFIKIIFIPSLLLAGLLISIIFDPSPGLGSRHQLFAFFCVFLAIASICFHFYPFSPAVKIGPAKPEALLALSSMMISFVVLDFMLRLIFPPVHQQTPYGWSVKENTSEETRSEDTPGNFRNITTKYYKNGFKRWGDIHTKKRKVLIIGDSFTEMNLVSNGEEWYAYLEKEFNNIELFVFGGGGYGSLQELMVLDDFFDEIKPDLILWQFCNNDYWNNLYEFDAFKYPLNDHDFRPYLENNEIVYRLPLPFASARKYSFIVGRILHLYDRAATRKASINHLADHEKNRAERESHPSAKQKQKLLLSQKAFEVTNALLGMVKKRIGETPIYMFNACGPLNEKEKKICTSNRFICIENVSERVDLKEREHYEVRVINDGHWNKLGNEVVGEELVSYFKEKNVLN